MFWFGALFGFVLGMALTIWLDRQPYNACPKGWFHYWVDASDGDRLCQGCNISEDEIYLGRKG